MATMEVTAAELHATENQVKMGKGTVAGPRRAVLGELTNCPAAAVNIKKAGQAKPRVISACAIKVEVDHEAYPTACAIKVEEDHKAYPTKQFQDPAAALPEPSVEPADVSMEEEELCQAFSDALLSVQDVDENDADLPQLCSEYVKDIYNYLHMLEAQQGVRANYMEGYEITERMRALLVDWLVQVHSRFQLLQETLYLTVAILDRFLQVQPVSRRKLQLVGVTAMLVASKYEEMYAPEVGDFAYITDNAYSRAQILEMEQVILKRLKFQLGRPLPLHFLRRASKVANSDIERHTLAKYLMELTLLDYQMVHYRPSEVAAAALCLSQQLLSDLPWSATQQHYSGYDEAHLKPIMRHIAKNVRMVDSGQTKFQAVKKKYASSKLLKISYHLQLSSPIVTKMAAPLLRNL